MHHQNHSCKLCKSNNLVLRVNIASTPPAEWYYSLDQKHLTEKKYPLDLFQCEDCGHVQLIDIIDPVSLFKNYFYTTASSPGLEDYFEAYATKLIEQRNLTGKEMVVDIGSNDGTFLSFFQKRGFGCVGIEPSSFLAKKALKKNVSTVAGFLDFETTRRLIDRYGKADIVTANNVFAHSEHLSEMLECVSKLMKETGCFVFEVSNLYDTILGRVFDFIYHEHVSYHSAKPLEKFMKSAGLRLIDVERTPSKGGTLRCFAVKDHADEATQPSVYSFIKLEEKAGLYEANAYQELENDIVKIADEFRQELMGRKAIGDTIVGYGASATVTTLLHQLEVGQFFDALVDDNPVRHNTYSPGYHIPVYSPIIFQQQKIDTVAILAWRYKDKILSLRESEFRDKCVIVPPIEKFILSSECSIGT